MSQLSSHDDVVVLGAGMAGFGAVYALAQRGTRARLYEGREGVGGHTSTHFYSDGFAFDEGPHISFTKNTRIQDLLAKGIGGEYETLRAYVNNYWRGYWIKHPAQINLHGLPAELVVDIIKDFLDVNAIEEPEIRNYEEWLVAAYGRTFATTFPMEYTKKYHTTDAKNLTTDWLGPRLYRPTLDQLLLGVLRPETPDVHYIDHFRYPRAGGFVAYLEQFKSLADIHTSHRVVAIDPGAKVVRFANGQSADYQALVSSIPLPELIPMIDGAPGDVVEAAEMLAASQVVLVNVGLNRVPDSRAQWTYFYDEDICFSRLSFPSSFAGSMAPKGYGSMQAEVYFSKKWKPMSGRPEDWIEPTIDGLLQCGLIKDRGEVVHTSTLFAPYANVIFDHDRQKSLATVHGYLDAVGVQYCGRYGDWSYIWTDESFISGEEAARRSLGEESNSAQ